MEKHNRSVIKSMSWRVIATCMTILIVFIFTGELLISLGVGIIEAISKLVAYYFHERLWNLISWGKVS